MRQQTQSPVEQLVLVVRQHLGSRIGKDRSVLCCLWGHCLEHRDGPDRVRHLLGLHGDDLGLQGAEKGLAQGEKPVADLRVGLLRVDGSNCPACGGELLRGHAGQQVGNDVYDCGQQLQELGGFLAHGRDRPDNVHCLPHSAGTFVAQLCSSVHESHEGGGLDVACCEVAPVQRQLMEGDAHVDGVAVGHLISQRCQHRGRRVRLLDQRRQHAGVPDCHPLEGLCTLQHVRKPAGRDGTCSLRNRQRRARPGGGAVRRQRRLPA
mmetsp:Transcript_34870/g.104291  ORF Transcript_34870/g.104291 Transcript_34870/m.104291 type:complete len:264 (-) Transcript_34870:169-960(-)